MITDNHKPFAFGKIPDGFTGRTATVLFFLIGGKTIAKHQSGCFTYHAPQAIDTKEALWLLHNHPSSNATEIQELS